MEFPSVSIQGNIVSFEILDKIRKEDIKYQAAADFALDRKTSVRDEIGIAWAAARAHWTAFRLRAERLKAHDSGASETRSSWIIPLLRELGYEVDKATAYVHPETKRSYAISHRATNLDGLPIHIMGIHDKLDERRDASGPRLSPHGLSQEYLNLTEHSYALVTNGRYLRLLRDATRLVRLSYLEFNLERMMEEDLYSDFALMFRLIHATRMPKTPDAAADSPIEYYHHESLSSGSRIRNALSAAVERSIKTLANGFLVHPANHSLREGVASGLPSADEYYLYQLRLIYRLLFLIVTEERNLVFPEVKDPAVQRFRAIYYAYYSIDRLRRMTNKRLYVDPHKHDLWEGLLACFRLFESDQYGQHLGIQPLGSGIFSPDALGVLGNLKLYNHHLLAVIEDLSHFENAQRQRVRVNYADLDVEEFGSVYEGLLEYKPHFDPVIDGFHFVFQKGSERSSSGSHYTPEELVKPLIKHSLEHLIHACMQAPDPEQALLALKVADVACGSGHILLSAARRLGLELARHRSQEDNPAPPVLRKSIRDVIRHCIYGVDKNPLAVELCKVALWLEAHNPGEPLNFLDHHIKCGDAIVGLGRYDELNRGISDAAFKSLPGDDKAVTKLLAKRNKQERQTRGQQVFDFEQQVQSDMALVLEAHHQVTDMPERTPAEIAAKVAAYEAYVTNHLQHLRQVADLQVAQFFITKDARGLELAVTDAEYFRFLQMHREPTFAKLAAATTLGVQRRFFHWFLEFPEVFAQGGFDCVLGNPPFLGGQKLSGNFGFAFLEFIKDQFAPIGAVDLVTFFFRRIFSIIRPKGFQALISTNTIAQGDARLDGLDRIMEEGGSIPFAVKSMRWPGLAAVEVSLVVLTKQRWEGPCYLGSRTVSEISTLLDDTKSIGDPYILRQNRGKSFQGSIVLGKGFMLSPEQALEIIAKDPKYKSVLFPYLNGENLNNTAGQTSERWVINFFDWPFSRLSETEWNSLSKDERESIVSRVKAGKLVSSVYPGYLGPVALDYPICAKIIENNVKDEREQNGREGYRKWWWHYAEKRVELYHSLKGVKQVLAIAQVSKTSAFSFVDPNQVLDAKLILIIHDQWRYFSVLQSNFHIFWAWKYSPTMKSDLSYAPTMAFQTFPNPSIYQDDLAKLLDEIGELYHTHRKALMSDIQLGLTKTYNLFHSQGLRTLTPVELALDDKALEKLIGKDGMGLRKHLNKLGKADTFNAAVAGILTLRELHRELDETVLAAYRWDGSDGQPAIALRHAFQEVDYLPENDRIRYTIHPEARKEILRRLLLLNHTLHEEEEKTRIKKQAELVSAIKKKRSKVESEPQQLLFKKEDIARTEKTDAPVSVRPVVLVDSVKRYNDEMEKFGLRTGIYSIAEAASILRKDTSKVREWFKTLSKSNYDGISDTERDDVEKLRVSFHGVIELVVIGTLLDQGIQLKDILQARSDLGKLTGKKYFPFTSIEVKDNLKVGGKSIYFELNDGRILTLDGTSQLNLELIRSFFGNIEFDSDGVAKRLFPNKNSRIVVIDPEKASGKPCIDRLEVQVATILDFYDGPSSTNVLINEFGLSHEEIDAALEYQKLLV